MNALDPIRHAYGEAGGAPPAPGEQGHAEYRLLRSTRDALDALPCHRPDASVLDAVKAAAKAHALRPLLAAYGEAEPPAPDTPRHAEYALLDGTREALDRLPVQRPDATVLDAVTAAARAATALGPLLHAYGEAEGAPPATGGPAYAEYTLLKGTREVLDGLPRPCPDAEALDAVRAAAKAHALRPLLAAYGEAEPPAPDTPRHAEYALLSATREALDRAPRSRPDATVLAAISAAAAEAVGGAEVPVAPALRPVARRSAGGDGARPADRPAREPVRLLRRLPAWIGTAAVLVIVATAGIWMLNEPPSELATSEPSDVVGTVPERTAEQEGPAADALPPSPSEEAQPAEALVAEAAPPMAARPSSGQARGRRVPEAEAAASAPRPVTSLRALPPPAAAPDRPDTGRVGFAAEEAVVPVAAWEAAADVRLLSLRLQQMAETSEGLSWDTSPMPFGATDVTPGSRLEGVQAVRGSSEPAHIEVRMRTPPSDRSDGQQPRR